MLLIGPLWITKGFSYQYDKYSLGLLAKNKYINLTFGISSAAFWGKRKDVLDNLILHS